MAKKRSSSGKAARRRVRKKKGVIGTRRKKEFTYRGHPMEDLEKMSLDEILDLLPARARRSYKRGLNEEQQAFLDRLRKTDEDIVKTHRREIVILPEFVGRKIAVHNGKEFIQVAIKPEMIGHYLGEFALTRRPVTHSGPGVGATRSSKYMPLK
ncbi:MAG: 30S ribosomal protein S19 [Thermoplasmata archaeon]